MNINAAIKIFKDMLLPHRIEILPPISTSKNTINTGINIVLNNVILFGRFIIFTYPSNLKYKFNS